MTHYQPHGRTAANAHVTAGQFQTANAVGQNTAQQRSKVPLEYFYISLGAGGRIFKSCCPDQRSRQISTRNLSTPPFTEMFFSGIYSVCPSQVHVVKMPYCPQRQCFQHIQGPRMIKSEGLEILLSASHFPKLARLEFTQFHTLYPGKSYPSHSISILSKFSDFCISIVTFWPAVWPTPKLEPDRGREIKNIQ